MYIPDNKLITRYKNGDEQALEIIIRRYKDKIYSFVYSKVQNTEVAEDIFQDTFIKVIVKLKENRYHEEGKFLPWVMRIAYNNCIDYFREIRKMPKVRESSGEEEYNIFNYIPIENENIEEEMVREQIIKDLHKLLVYLPIDQREVVELRIFKQMSFKEIAEATGVSINTSLGRMRYALLNIRKLIEEHKIILQT